LDSHQERVAVMTPSAHRFRERAVEADRLLRMQPRWLAPVTWRLVGMALLVAVALVARHVWDALTSGEVPLGHYWPGALLHVNAYVVAATEIGTDATPALDEQLVQKVLPRLRGDADAAPSIDSFIALTDGRYPLANAKARSMRAELNTHGFVTFF